MTGISMSMSTTSKGSSNTPASAARRKAIAWRPSDATVTLAPARSRKCRHSRALSGPSSARSTCTPASGSGSASSAGATSVCPVHVGINASAGVVVRGRVSVKVVPAPGTLCTTRSPPSMCASCCESASPRPLPLTVSAVEVWENRRKRSASSCSLIPGPVSRTETIQRLPETDRSTVTEPNSVNFTALPMRLRRICRTRSGSETVVAGPLMPGSKRNPMPFAAARAARNSTASFAMARRSMGERAIDISPASTRAASMMSFTTPRMCWPLRAMTSPAELPRSLMCPLAASSRRISA